jgi:hypothetical protein
MVVTAPHSTKPKYSASGAVADASFVAGIIIGQEIAGKENRHE